jgi:predicted adenine nucleotide alpha hydrolase (AANH) superfamily ATPase
MPKQLKILLHACCAPCVTVPIRRLSAESVTDVFFYNPNISPREEYLLREREITELGRRWEFHVQTGPYDYQNWRKWVRGHEDDPERGVRCQLCIKMRLQKTAQMAKAGGYDQFTTTLTLSPLKDAGMIHLIGQEVAELTDVEFLAADFKKHDGFKQSVEYSRLEKLYRQDFCGCQFSRRKRRIG